MSKKRTSVVIAWAIALGLILGSVVWISIENAVQAKSEEFCVERMSDSELWFQTDSTDRSPSKIKQSSSDYLVAKERIVEGMKEIEDKIDLSDLSITIDDIKSIHSEIADSEAELFYWDMNYLGYKHRDGMVSCYLPQYTYVIEKEGAEIPDQEKIQKMKDEFDAVVSYIVEGADESFSDLEKALYVHEELLNLTTYDDTLEYHDAYHTLVEGRGVCQGYTLAYSYLLEKLGVLSVPASSETLNHIWNVVCVDGKWYNVDATWDDLDHPIGVGHEYFLLSDDALFALSPERSDKVSIYGCEDKTYDKKSWSKVRAPFVYTGSKWLYLQGSILPGTGSAELLIFQWDPETGKSTDFNSYTSEAWKLADGSGSYLSKALSGLVYYNGDVYFNSPNEILCCSAEEADSVIYCYSQRRDSNLFLSLERTYEEMACESGQINLGSSGVEYGIVYSGLYDLEKEIEDLQPAEEYDPSKETTQTTTSAVDVIPASQEKSSDSASETKETDRVESKKEEGKVKEVSSTLQGLFNLTKIKVKGKRIVVSTKKATKVVVKVNRKILKAKKNYVNKTVIAKKNNRTGKVKIQAKSIQKGLKIKVIVYDSGNIVVKNLSIV